MAAKDRFHEAVRKALEKEQWVITADPLKVEVGGAKNENLPSFRLNDIKLSG